MTAAEARIRGELRNLRLASRPPTREARQVDIDEHHSVPRARSVVSGGDGHIQRSGV